MKTQNIENMHSTISFKSIPGIYFKEKNNNKPNTVRKIDKEDYRFKALESGIAKEIGIINSQTGENFFRNIKDVTFWEDMVIISWFEEPN